MNPIVLSLSTGIRRTKEIPGCKLGLMWSLPVEVLCQWLMLRRCKACHNKHRWEMGNMDQTSAFSAVNAADVIPRVYNFADDVLRRNLAAGRADKPAFIDPRGSWTYGQLAERVLRFSHVLRKLGIAREDRVLLCLTDTIDWPTAFLGAIKAGIVAVPVNTLLHENDYRFMLSDSRAKLLVVSEELYPRFANLIGSSPDLVA